MAPMESRGSKVCWPQSWEPSLPCPHAPAMSKHADPGPGCGQGRQWVLRLCRVEAASGGRGIGASRRAWRHCPWALAAIFLGVAVLWGLRALPLNQGAISALSCFELCPCPRAPGSHQLHEQVMKLPCHTHKHPFSTSGLSVLVCVCVGGCSTQTGSI